MINTENDIQQIEKLLTAIQQDANDFFKRKEGELSFYLL